MGWSESCKRHPSLRRSPGVCPSCLTERLTLLSRSPLFTTAPSGYASSGGASSPARGSTRQGHGHQRMASEVNYSLRSGSVGFVPRCYSHRFGINDDHYDHKKNNNNNNKNNYYDINMKINNNYNYYKEKKSSFWSKLISGKRRNKNSTNLSSRLSTMI